jgi:hypothetical protein
MIRLALIPILMAAGAWAGEGGGRLRFTRTSDLPESGLKLLLPSGAKPDPLPPPSIVEGVRKEGGKEERLELQNPLEVWRWKQLEGRWIDEKGNRLVLVAPTLSVPEFEGEWAPKDKVAGLLQSLPDGATSWSAPDMARWLEAFWGVSGLAADPLLRGRPFAIAEAFFFKAALPDGKGLAFAFRLTATPDRWRFALVELARGTDPAAAEKAMREDFLPSIQALSRRPGSTATTPPVVSNKPLTAFDESRNRVRESIRNMKDWWTVEGANTIVLSNIRSGKSQLVDAILEDLEKLRPVWESMVPPWEHAREVAVVRVFGTAEEYVRYVGADKAWTAGLWVNVRRELMIRPVEEGSLISKRKAVLTAVYHEGFHQYLDSAFGGVAPAPWFNEGYATLFGSTVFSGGRVTFAKEAGAAATLAQLVRQGRADPARILGLDYAAFYGKDDDTRRENYALAWGLMYFLQGEADNRKSDQWRGIPARYAAALKENRDPNQATRKAFDGVDMDAFTKAFHSYWK